MERLPYIGSIKSKQTMKETLKQTGKIFLMVAATPIMTLAVLLWAAIMICGKPTERFDEIMDKLTKNER